MQNLLKYLKGDPVIWVIALIMLAFSLVSVYSFVPILVKVEGGTPFKVQSSTSDSFDVAISYLNIKKEVTT